MSDFNRSGLSEPNVFETNLHTVNVFDCSLYDTRTQDFAYGILETVGNYYQPNGIDIYYRPDGESFYFIP